MMTPLDTDIIVDFLVSVLDISESYLAFPDFVFFIVIPFLVCMYTLYLFMQGMKIFRGSADFVNTVMSVLIVLVLLRYVYPVLFTISLLYLTFIEKWPRSMVFRIGFLVLMVLLYLWLFPFMVNLTAGIS